MVSEASTRSSIAGLSVDPTLRKFVDQQLLPGTGVTTEVFWQGLGSIVKDLMPTNASLLLERDSLQRQVDEWHTANPAPYDEGAYTAFLERISYLAPEDKLESFEIETRDVDAEISTSFGPQLVCPVVRRARACPAPASKRAASDRKPVASFHPRTPRCSTNTTLAIKRVVGRRDHSAAPSCARAAG